MKTPPLDFLMLCSRGSLQDFELGRLNQIANLVKQVQTIQDELRQIEGEALLARWLMDYREELLSAGAARGMQQAFEFQSPTPASPLTVRPSRKALQA